MKTKHIPIMIGLVLISISNSNAQNLNFGLSTGYDLVNIHQKPWDPPAVGPPFHSRKSYNFNCYISYKTKGIWGFSVYPGFIQKGASNGVNNGCKWEFDYIQIPLLADIYVLHRLFLSVGPEFSYMVDGRAVNSYPQSKHTDDVSSIFKKCELSGFIGINCLITKGIGIGLGYNHGLTYIRKVPFYGDYSEILGWGKQYNQYLQLKIIFRIKTIELTNSEAIR